MTLGILLCGVILAAGILANKLSAKIGVPSLLFFIAFGIVMGEDGIFKIPFDNYVLTGDICSIALIFIMFYGGFGTNWNAAKPVALQAILLSFVGTILTAFFTGLFCYYALKMDFYEALLTGAVISSTDAASVFAILRSKKLNLKHGLASMLEIESGSNDPAAYMLTMIILSLMTAQQSTSPAYLVFAQIVYGLLCGFAIAFGAIFVLKRAKFGSDGLYAIFMVAIALVSYALPTLAGGNGYLSVYITGIFLGNAKLRRKIELVHFFDGITWIMQIILFFVIGLLSFPSKIPDILLPAVAIALFLTFVSRPVAVTAILSCFKTPIRQQVLVAWSGLRGAASIVFAIMAVAGGAYTNSDIFHIVFLVALLSVGFQGTFLPVIAKKLDLVDTTDTVFKTFNDYADFSNVQVQDIRITESHPWSGKTLGEISPPSDMLILMVVRDEKSILPKGSTMLLPGDMLLLSSVDAYENSG